MSTARLIPLFDLASMIESTLTVDQITSTIIFGPSSTPGVFQPTHQYRVGDLCTYVDSYGGIHVLECIRPNDTTNPELNPEDWQEYSILNAINRASTNLIILSRFRPDEDGNRVWLQYRGGGGDIPDNNYGLIIKNNFVISPNEPENFTPDLVWGKVQVG